MADRRKVIAGRDGPGFDRAVRSQQMRLLYSVLIPIT